jgi:hypothetical protein
MKLALRKGPAPDANALGKLSATAIKLRIVTNYPHSGIVIDGDLYHATAQHGVIAEPFDPEGWEVFDIGGDDARALSLFKEQEHKGYDWVSLFAFVMVNASDSQRWYCFELSFYLMTGKRPGDRVTPETLLIEAKKLEAT